MGTNHKYEGLLAQLARRIPTGDYGEAEPFLEYLTVVVLIAPLTAILIWWLVSLFVPQVGISVALFLVAISETVWIMITHRAVRLAEDDNFQLYWLEKERTKRS